jgi:hypothetical protein
VADWPATRPCLPDMFGNIRKVTGLVSGWFSIQRRMPGKKEEKKMLIKDKMGTSLGEGRNGDVDMNGKEEPYKKSNPPVNILQTGNGGSFGDDFPSKHNGALEQPRRKIGVWIESSFLSG